MGQTRNLRDGQIKIQDSGGTNSVTLTLEMGDLSWTQRKNRIKVLDRGVLDHVRAGDEEPVTLSFSVKVDRVSEATSPVTLYDALNKTRSASTWVSTAGSHEPYAVDIIFTIADPTGGADDETITFTKFFYEELTHSEGDEFNTLEASGFAYQTSPTLA